MAGASSVDTSVPPNRRAPKPPYELFMAVMTIFSLAVLAVLVVDQLIPFEAGYGDEVPVTEGGRIVAALTMVVGIGIFGVIAGSLARFLAPRNTAARGSNVGDSELGVVAQELAALRAEVAELRRTLESGSG